MSTYVMAFKGQDEEWSNMKNVYEACQKANIAVPEEVMEFFENKKPSIYGANVDIKSATSKWNEDMQEGLEVDLTELPDGVRFIRFINSW
jgi:hypothetical protein